MQSFPAGTYYLGDPIAVYGTEFSDRSAHTLVDTIPVAGGEFIASCMYHGNGEYEDSDGVKYTIRSGTIAIIPWHLCEKQNMTESDVPRYGRLLTFLYDGTFTATSRGTKEIRAGFREIHIDVAREERYSDEDDSEEDYSE